MKIAFGAEGQWGFERPTRGKGQDQGEAGVGAATRGGEGCGALCGCRRRAGRKSGFLFLHQGHTLFWACQPSVSDPHLLRNLVWAYYCTCISPCNLVGRDGRKL